MQVNGTIANIAPDGGYQSQNGWIFTFQMTIDTPQGQVVGRIGSKSEQYPMQGGEQITVEQSNKGYGNEFKKVNAQYAGQQGGQQQPRQQASHPAQGGASKDRLIVTQVAYKALMEKSACDEGNLRQAVDMIMRVGENKPAQQQAPPQNQLPPQQEPPFNPTDDIPF